MSEGESAHDALNGWNGGASRDRSPVCSLSRRSLFADAFSEEQKEEENVELRMALNNEVQIGGPSTAIVSSSDDFITVLSIADDAPILPPNRRMPNIPVHIRSDSAPHNLPTSPKPKRRIEFRDSTRSRAKSCHENRGFRTSVSESSGLGAQLRRDRSHKSGFFGALSDDYDDELSDVPPEALALGLRAQRCVLSKETMGIGTGISVIELPDSRNPGKLSAVEIIRIDEQKRIAIDDQLKVGDRILKINGRPVYQMSLAAARVYLDELSREPEPTILFYRIPKEETERPIQFKPVTVPLQKGNTTALQNVRNVQITKRSDGFGFGVASRPSGSSNIFVITSVVAGGAADGILESGDRVLQIGDSELSDFTQRDVVSVLKSQPIGEPLILRISRQNKEEEKSTEEGRIETEIVGLKPSDAILELKIPVNETVAAGLGIALMGPTGDNTDSGVFVSRILQGSAAYKDGRLREGDRILGIGTLNLLPFVRNSEAVRSFHAFIAQMSPSSGYFRLYVSRPNAFNHPNSVEREDFVKWIKDSEEQKERTLERKESTESTTEEATEENGDPFSRESATRKSFSEKGPFGMRRDPSEFENFRRIAHQRQISAPTIGHRRQRGVQFVRRSSIGTPKRCPSPPQQRPQSPWLIAPTSADKSKTVLSILSFFGLRSRKDPDKENLGQNPSMRRSASGEPTKMEQKVRNENSVRQSEREALRKKHRSVGASVMKFFQKTESPNPDDHSETKTETRSPSSAFHPHRLPVQMEFDSFSGTAPTPADHFLFRNVEFERNVGGSQRSGPYDYYDAFNQWFTNASTVSGSRSATTPRRRLSTNSAAPPPPYPFDSPSQRRSSARRHIRQPPTFEQSPLARRPPPPSYSDILWNPRSSQFAPTFAATAAPNECHPTPIILTQRYPMGNSPVFARQHIPPFGTYVERF